MKVKATDLGFYGERRRRPGDVFNLTDSKHFSERWMEKLEEDAPAKRGPKPKKTEEEQGE